MVNSIEEILGPLRKVLSGLKEEPALLRDYFADAELTVDNFSTAISNHLLTDDSKKFKHFGLTRKEGQQIREYVQESSGEYRHDMHKELVENFPDLIVGDPSR